MAISINDKQLDSIKKWIQQHPGMSRDLYSAFHVDSANQINAQDIEDWMINTLEYYLKEEFGYEAGLDT